LSLNGELLTQSHGDKALDRSPSHVELRGVSKRFGGVQALAEINLTVERGLVHALVGENGAGKSTLGKIISGVIPPDAGKLLVDGRSVGFRSPRDALVAGIAMIQQEISLVPKLTVLENVYLGTESHRGGFLRSASTLRRFEALNGRTSFGLSPNTLVSRLGVAEQKRVEILKALARHARLIVMDEPTAALPEHESEKLLAVVRSLRDSGATIVFVSHFLEQVLGVADTVTVLRDGKLVSTTPAKDETPANLVSAMLGHAISLAYPPKVFPTDDAPVVCSVRDLSRRGSFKDISFDIRAGEIVGLAGLVGSGRSDVARAIFGATQSDRGTIEIDGRSVRMRSPCDAVRAGLALLPESRKEQGLLMRMSVAHNVTLPHLESVSSGSWVRARQEQSRTLELLERLDVRPIKPLLRMSALSGGNQQKVLFGKWLFRRPRLFIADEPTHGVDVGAKAAIYQLIASLAQEGMAVLLISSELDEILGLSHRVIAMRRGQIVAELSDGPGRCACFTEDAVMHAIFMVE